MRHLHLSLQKEPDYFVQTELDKLRVSVGFLGAERKVLLFTSSEPNEGKSFISVNTWLDLAKAGKRVCFVDADMRKSNLRSTLKLIPQEGEFLGLSHLLSGQAKLSEVLYSTTQENAYMIPTTTLINPSLLLEDRMFEELMTVLRRDFDYIIVDTPPVGLLSDGLMVAKRCDGAVLVVRAHTTRRESALNVVRQLEQFNCPLMGVVLNRVDLEKSKNYYSGYYSKYYSSSYYSRHHYYYYANAQDSAREQEEAEKKERGRKKS